MCTLYAYGGQRTTFRSLRTLSTLLEYWSLISASVLQLFLWWLMSFWKIIRPCFPSDCRSAGVTGANHCLQCFMWSLRICTQVTRPVWQAFLSTESSLHPQPVSSLKMKRKGMLLRRSTQKYPSNPGYVDILL